MSEHPLISTLRTAGELSRTVAANLKAQNYGAFDLSRNLSILADALVDDATGHSLMHDRCVLDDRDRSTADRNAARARNAARTQIAQTLGEFPREYRVRLIDALITGEGAKEAEALALAAQIEMDALLATLHADTITATATA